MTGDPVRIKPLLEWKKWLIYFHYYRTWRWGWMNISLIMCLQLWVVVEVMVSKEIHSCDTVMLRALRQAASGPHSLSTSLRDHDALRRLCHSLRSHYFWQTDNCASWLHYTCPVFLRLAQTPAPPVELKWTKTCWNGFGCMFPTSNEYIYY